MAVIAGTEEWWQNVEDQWIVRCGGIPFHATDCESNEGDYKNIPNQDNKAMYRDLTGILASSLLGAIAIAIDLTAQKQIIPGALPLAYYRRPSAAMLRAGRAIPFPSSRSLTEIPAHWRWPRRVACATP